MYRKKVFQAKGLFFLSLLGRKSSGRRGLQNAWFWMNFLYVIQNENSLQDVMTKKNLFYSFDNQKVQHNHSGQNQEE